MEVMNGELCDATAALQHPKRKPSKVRPTQVSTASSYASWVCAESAGRHRRSMVSARQVVDPAAALVDYSMRLEQLVAVDNEQ